MKVIHKHVLVAALLLVYGLGFGFSNAGITLPAGNCHDASASQLVTAWVSDIGFHILQSESAVSNSIHLPFRSVKEGKFVGGLLPIMEAATEHSFKQLVHLFKGLLLNLRKSDLLFPAHFFW